MVEAIPQLVLIAVLVVLNAAFAGTELALVSLREGQLQRLSESSAKGAMLARLAGKPNQYLATIQVGITLAGFLASAAAAVSLAEPLEGPLGFLGDGARPVSVIVVTIALAYITLVFGELVPKRIALQRAEAWAMAMTRPLAALTAVTRPAVWLLSHSTDAVVSFLGVDPSQQREEVTNEELRDMVTGHRTLTPEQRHIIDGAFEVADRTLGEILVPRSSVFVLDKGHTCHEALRLLADSGHSRAPVAPAENLDATIGVVHMRQLLEQQADTLVSDFALEVPAFPEAAHVLPVIRDLQAARSQMAMVVNEHGGIEGIVTIEDLVEELVGEIYDETDPDMTTVYTEDDGTKVLPGSYPMHDLVDIGLSLPKGNYATVAGFILDHLSEIPAVGTRLTVDDSVIEVRRIDRHAITEIAISSPPAD